MLHWNTVDQSLKACLVDLMQAPELKKFRLVGGTALSLYLGHRLSIDIDLFTDAPYRSVDFDEIEKFLLQKYKYVTGDFGGNPGMGKSYLAGTDRDNAIKLDLYYAMDPFFQDYVTHDDIRMATVEEIIAMKVDVILRGGRKKDYWDLHQLLENYTIDQMIELHQKRFEWTHDREKILINFKNFSDADLDFDPICLKSKEWIFIKEDFELALKDVL
ncbi:nucleotidyl transferase AbiEii/AbiGii toxin family protein [Pedobacter petrophilus]|uniref:Nucleotidyl transferase AbiEii/AbiGii toxin family protein n=1 Tax=Pedobacter petrophilus TaxID=1908241 RepID=A0A7K0G0I7_9SPHI|nr:nucleotidyl transferase AbiEii/AbiGii toxin family protein [Pedobacter petrophilus]MRX77363.1 nucleotidyl transferase AbiEii/AbiGii toxin family protein [Pedobacter petrophilus]